MSDEEEKSWGFGRDRKDWLVPTTRWITTTYLCHQASGSSNHHRHPSVDPASPPPNSPHYLKRGTFSKERWRAVDPGARAGGPKTRLTFSANDLLSSAWRRSWQARELMPRRWSNIVAPTVTERDRCLGVMRVILSLSSPLNGWISCEVTSVVVYLFFKNFWSVGVGGMGKGGRTAIFYFWYQGGRAFGGYSGPLRVGVKCGNLFIYFLIYLLILLRSHFHTQ